MAEAQQETLVLPPENHALNASASTDPQVTSSDPIAEHPENRREDSTQQAKTCTPEEEAAIREQVEKAFELRKEYITKECMEAKKRLDLNCSNVDDLDAYTITLCLNERPPTLELLHLGANKLTGEGLRIITSSLGLHTNLRELYLGNNKFNSEGIEELINILPNFQNLQTLSLCNNGLKDETGVALVAAFEDLKSLRSVMLNTNFLSDLTFLMLADYLKAGGHSITTLHLGENKSTSVGLMGLFEVLENDKTLKNLYLNDTLLLDDSAKALNRMLVRNKTLSLLNIGNCGVDDETISFLKCGLMFNQGLKSLFLWGNRISNHGGYFLKTILEDHNTNITAMALSDNSIEDEVLLAEIKIVLKRNDKLENIENMKNRIFELYGEVESLKELKDVEALKTNKRKVDSLLREVNNTENKLEEAKQTLVEIKEKLN